MSVAAPSGELLRIEERNDVTYICLNRPPLNVLNIALMRDISAAVRRAGERPENRAVVLGAEGKAFSVGAEVNEVKSDRMPELLGIFHEMIKTVLYSPLPVVARVQGPALGGGCELATAADIVVIA
ncbi:MAG: enoyl-CoA hydratase/isomerase family protein, partial [Chloroflexota bacterium]|nr:enoyl-CoA hydratase/isomerase family protein [Chloroflexota bacterium]